MRVLAFHHCTSGLIPGPGVTHGLSLLLALILALKVFLQVLWFSTLGKPTLQIPIQSGNSRQKEPPFGMSIAKSQLSISYYIGIIKKSWRLCLQPGFLPLIWSFLIKVEKAPPTRYLWLALLVKALIITQIIESPSNRTPKGKAMTQPYALPEWSNIN